MVKHGYKQTEIGVIPEEWKIASLKDLSDGRFTYGVNAPAIPYAPPLPNYIRITDISDDGRFMRESRTSVDCQNPEMYTLKENDIVFARTGASTGKTYLYRKNDGDLVYAGFLIKASILPEKANSKYVFDNLHTNRYWDWVSVTSMRSGQPGINGNEYASYMIPCPPLPEQEHIAEALSDVDSMISSLEKLIAKKKAIKQGAMQELLTEKKRLPEFTGEWTVKYIDDIATIMDNCRIPVKESDREKMAGTIPYCGANGIVGYINGYTIDDEIILIAEDGGYFDEYATRPIAYKMSGKCWVNNHAHILKSKSNTDQNYLFYCLVHKDIRDFISSGTRSKLNKAELLKITIKLPLCLEEQIAIASILSDMDNEIETLEQKLAKTRQIKQGMMQQLLTGKIRLV